MLYACLDKNTNEPQGVVYVAQEDLADWEKKHIMKPVSDAFRGKQPHEMKVSGSEVKLKAQAEVDAYLQQQEQNQENTKLLKLKQDMIAANAIGN